MSWEDDASNYTDESGNPDTSKIEAEAERRGLNAAEKQSFIADIIRRVSITVKKAQAVVDDAEKGAEYGSVVPGFGTAAGTIAGAVYGVYTEFGDDIKSALSGGPRWTEDQYNVMRKSCHDAGGVSVPGRPPNNLDSCQFPDGTLSGGDTPVWASQADYESDQSARALNLTHVASYIDGLHKIDAMIVQADAAVRKLAAKGPGSITTAIAARKTWMNAIGNAFGTIYNATKLESSPPANVAQFLSDMSPRIYTPVLPPVATQAQFVAAAKALKHMPTMLAPPNLKTMPPAAQQAFGVALADATGAAHALLTAAKSGDATAHAAIADTASKAAAGDPNAQHALVILTVADAEQFINTMIDQWVYGKVRAA